MLSFNAKFLFTAMIVAFSLTNANATQVAEVNCLVNGANLNVGDSPVVTEIDSISFDKSGSKIIKFKSGFEPKVYEQMFSDCLKAFAKINKKGKILSGGYSVEGSYMFNDKSNMAKFWDSTRAMQNEKLGDFLWGSADTYTDYGAFKIDLNRTQVYITNGLVDLSKINKQKEDSYIKLFSSDGKNAIFNRSNIAKDASSANYYMADELAHKFNNGSSSIKGFTSAAASLVSKFILMTSNQGSLHGLYSFMLSANTYVSLADPSEHLAVKWIQNDLINSYQILSVSSSGEVTVKFTQLSKIANIYNLNGQTIYNFGTGGVDILSSIEFKLSNSTNKKHLLNVEVNAKSFNVMFPGKVNSNDLNTLTMFFKGSFINSMNVPNPVVGKNPVSKTEGMDITFR